MLCATVLAVSAGARAEEESAEEQPIAAVQALLRQERLYSGPVDGVVGVDTVAAIRRYQILHGLRATGNLDSATLRAMLLPPRPLSGKITAEDRELLRELTQTPIPETVVERRKPLPPADLPPVVAEPKHAEKKSVRSSHRRTRSHSPNSD